MSMPLKRGKINMVRSENILTLQFPLVKGKLILCEAIFLQLILCEAIFLQLLGSEPGL